MARSQVGASRFGLRKTAVDGMQEPRCRVMVLGIGGAGNNTISRLEEKGLTGAQCVAVNTDLHDLNSVCASRKILIGEKVTRGLSAGGNPEVGRAALEESRFHIESLLENVDVVFLAVGLGGGTGAGAAPVVAEIARGKGAVVIGVVTAPLATERSRVSRSIRALNAMKRVCDTVVVVDCNKLVDSCSQVHPAKVYDLADQVMADMIKGIVETLTSPSLINLDFSDFRAIMRKGGIAVVGVGESASNRAEEAVRNALKTPTFDVDYARAKGAVVHVSGDPHMTIEEANRVGEIVTEMIGRNALVSWGAQMNPDTEAALKVTLVMTGVRSPYSRSRLVNMMPKLYNIESQFSEPEKPLHIDFGLDQIENFED